MKGIDNIFKMRPIPNYYSKLWTTLGATSLLVGMLAQNAQGQINAYWKADGNALDSSGNGNNGTLVGPVTYGPGKFGEAFDFDSSDYVSVSDPSFNLGASDFTITLWANFDSLNGNSAGQLPNTFVAQDEGGGSQNKWVFFYDSSAQELMFHENGYTGYAFVGETLPAAPSLGSWNMYTVTGTGTSLSFFFDGQYLGTTNGVPVPTVAAPITLGEAEGIGWWSGGLDDVRIYGTSLNQDQIGALYKNGATTPGPAAAIPFLLGACFRRRRSSAR